MNVILLSGGSGKRLWPLSNAIRSKQFIKFFKNANGDYESMLQRIYRQIKAVDKEACLTLATSKAQVSSILHQLGSDVLLSVEPCRRDTFPAIALAVAYLHDKEGLSQEEVVVVCPVDPYVENDYFSALHILEAEAKKGEENLVLMGIDPAYPSEKYGYIIPKTKERFSKVEGFTEKPTTSKAKTYIAQGALWNAGVFAFKVGYLLGIAEACFGFKDYDTLLKNYATLKKISFDYAVVEKEKSIGVLRFKGAWQDVGTWNTLTETMSENILGKALMSEDCNNVHIVNALTMPVLAMGLNDLVISASLEGILVANKEKSSEMKPFVEKIEGDAMFADKSWGSYQVILVEKESLVLKVSLNPLHFMHYHSHKRRAETWFVLSGEGKVILDEEERLVKTGDTVTIKSGCKHTIFACSRIELIEIQQGKDISVEDKEKWGDSRAYQKNVLAVEKERQKGQ